MKFPGFRKSKATDEELMAAVRKGDREAFAMIYDRYSSSLVGFFYRMLNNDLARAQDFMHDLFVKLIENPESFDCERSFSTWIYTVAYNLCKNEYRRVTVRHEYAREVVAKNEEPFEHIKSSHDTRLFEARLQDLLRDMNEKHRTVFLMRHQQGLSLKEIAEVLDCPEGTVKSRLFNATRELADSLKEYDPR